MCGILMIFKHKTIMNICLKLVKLKVKYIRVTFWTCGTDQNQTENESRKLLSLQMESRVIQIAKADSVINGVYLVPTWIPLSPSS